MNFIALLILFFLSGTAGLIYEASWNRQIGLYLGNTTQSSSIVLGCFFFGMAIGYRVGLLWPKSKSPLAGYGFFELVTGISACFLPQVLHFVMDSTWVDLPEANTFHSNPNFLLIKNCLLVFICLLPSTTALGATLPLMSETLKSSFGDQKTGAKISMAYGLNTIGAVTGLLLCSYFLFLWCGVKGSSYVAAGISLLCAALAFLFAHKVPASGTVETPSTRRIPLSFFYIAAVSGFTALGLEVLYLRLFSLIFHNSTYTFGLVLTTFLLALALGSIVVSYVPQKRLYQAFQLAIIFATVSVLASLFLMVRLTGLNYFVVGDTFFQYISGAFLLVAIVILPPTCFCGFVLPLTWRLLISDGINVSQVVSRCTMWNSIFAAIGAIITNFWLLPFLGLFPAFGFITLLLGSLCLTKPVSKTSIRSYRTASLLTWFILFSVTICSTAYLHINVRDSSEYDRTIVKRWNSIYGWIDLAKDRNEHFQVNQNLHYRHGSTGASWQRQRRQSILPLVLHPNPKKTLFLGLGTGVTASGALSVSEVESIEIIELIPEVAAAVSQMETRNLNILKNPKTKISFGDARHFLKSARTKYDVIIADLFVPWESQTGYLYTQEHYSEVSKSLSSDGLFFQNLAVYQLGDQQLTTILDTMRKEFRFVSLWWVYLSSGNPMIGVCGSQRPIDTTQFDLRKRLVEVNSKYKTDVYLGNLKNFFSCYIGDWQDSGQGIINSDEYPVIEFTTPKAFGDDRLLSGETWIKYYSNRLHELKFDGAIKKTQPDIEFGELRELHLYMLKEQRSWN